MTNKLQEFIEDLCPQPVDLAEIMSVLSSKLGDQFGGLYKQMNCDSFYLKFYFGYNTGITAVDWDINKKFFEQKPEIQLEIAELLGFRNE